MPNLNTKLSALIISAAFLSPSGAAFLATPAMAQDTPTEDTQAEELQPSEATLEKATHVEALEAESYEVEAKQIELETESDVDMLEPSPTLADYFTAADVDGDAALNGEEYKVFVDTLADSGDEAYIAIRDGGTYGEAFASTDTDVDGLVTYLEVSGE